MKTAMGIVPTVKARNGSTSLNGINRNQARTRKTARDPTQETVAMRLNFFVYVMAFMIESLSWIILEKSF